MIDVMTAARMALEALRLSVPKPRSGCDDYIERGWTEHEAAITALRQAIEQVEQCPHGADAACKECYEAEQQEPVAWRLYKDGELYALKHDKEDRGPHYKWEPLYTHPQRKPEPCSREEFERFAQNTPMGWYCIDRSGNGYRSSDTQLMWDAWQAAHGIKENT